MIAAAERFQSTKREEKAWTMLRPAALPPALPAAFLQLTHGS
jgi:hypothetical protein